MGTRRTLILSLTVARHIYFPLKAISNENEAIFLVRETRPLGPGKIDGLLVLPGKAYALLTGHLIIG